MDGCLIFECANETYFECPVPWEVHFREIELKPKHAFELLLLGCHGLEHELTVEWQVIG